ncbi:MAG: ribonuclease III [Bdellovibrionaceae bacterium]|nr:ribonuclease III [Pseudobdellovibrionaceae bacterium]
MGFIELLAEKLEIEIHNPALFEQAFNHKSLSKGNDSVDHNERLEYLGDAVLGLVVADVLYRAFPQDDEGNLSRKRASLVNETALSRISDHFGLSENLRAHNSHSLEELQHNPRITASLFEAVVGAMYIDLGYQKTHAWVEKVMLKVIGIDFDDHDFSSDYKSRFQELLQSKQKITPVYETIESTGPDHQRSFTVIVSVDGQVHGEGQGPSKKIAAQEAAKNALAKEESHD